MYKIEKNIPIPPTSKTAWGRIAQTLDKMEIGDSFLLPHNASWLKNKTEKQMAAAFRSGQSKRYSYWGEKRHFHIVKEADGYRIWRTEQPKR